MTDDRRVAAAPLITGPGAPTLGSLGERRLIRDVIAPRFTTRPPWIWSVGDDCAVMDVEGGRRLALTTDPCPLPVVALLGDTDLFHWGWLTVVINLSDLAAVGATPLGLVASVVAPPDLSVSDFHRYLDGIEQAGARWNCPLVGGNMKDGQEFSVTGTAVGELTTDPLSRGGGADGDVVLVAGDVGLFWSAVLSKLTPLPDAFRRFETAFSRALFRPTPKVEWGCYLAASGSITSCVDASDGLGSALVTIAEATSTGVILDYGRLIQRPHVLEVAEAAAVHPLNLALSWGDWQLVFTAPPAAVPSILQHAPDDQIQVIGKLSADHSSHVHVEQVDASPRTVAVRGGERFAAGSYFTEGLDGYIETLQAPPFMDGD